MAFLGSLLSIKLAIEVLFYFENAMNLPIRSEAVIEKLAKARKATPNSKIERRPPIILNHSSTTFLSIIHHYLPWG